MGQSRPVHLVLLLLVCLSLLGSFTDQANSDKVQSNCSPWESTLKDQLSSPAANFSDIIASIGKNISKLSPECVKSFNLTSNLTAVAQLLKVLNSRYDDLTPQIRNAIYSWVEAMGKAKASNATKGESSWITLDILKILGRFILQAPSSTLQSLVNNFINPVCQLYNSNTSLWGQLFDLTPVQANYFLSGLQKCNVTLTDPTVIQKLGQLTCFYNSLVEKLSQSARDALQNQLPNCTNNINEIYQKLLSLVPSANMTGDRLKKLGDAAKALSAKQLANISSSAISDALESLGKIKDWSESQRKVLVKKVTEATNVTGDTLYKLGSLVAGMSVKTLKNMTSKDLLYAFQNKNVTDAVKYMKPAQMKSIMNTILNSSTDDGLKKLPEILVPEVPLMKLREISNETVMQLLNKSINWTTGQALVVCKKMPKNELNNPAFISTLNAAARGLTCETIQSLQPAALRALAANPYISRDQIRCAATRFFSYGNTTDFSYITQDYLNTVPASFLLYIKSFSDVQKIPKSLCYNVVKLIGQADIKLLPRSSGRRSELQNYTMNCLNITDTKALTQDQANDLGSLVCTFGSTNIQKLTTTVFMGIVDQLQQCGRFDEPVKSDIRNKILQTYNDTSTWTVDVLNQLQSLLAIMTSNDLKRIANTEDVKASLLGIIASQPKASSGFTAPDFDNRPNLKPLYEKLAAIFSTSLTQTSKRRKRDDCTSVHVPTSDDISKLGDGNTIWTVTQLTCMSNSTFTDSLDTLATVQGFSSDQLQALKIKAVQVFGQPISLDQLASLKRFTLAFNDDEVKQYFQGVDTDTLTSISQYVEWSTTNYSTRALTIVQNFLASKTVNQLSSTDLVGLGYFLCVFSADQIRNIDTTAYSSAAADIGNLNCSDTNALVALKNKAVETFGSPNSWTGEVLQEIGTVAAGLNASEIQQLSDAVVQYISSQAIARLPPSVFSAMSLSQLQSLGIDNYGAVSNDQINALSPTKRDAFNGNSGSTSQTPQPGASGAVQWRPMTIATILLISLSVIF